MSCQLFSSIWQSKPWTVEIWLLLLYGTLTPLSGYPTNYRPITLTSCVCKVIERMVNNRLVWYLERNTRSPAIAEGPRDAGVPVEIW